MSTSGGCTPASSRWNPTKEQVSLLESLYKQGIRTPSTEQIEQITTRLRVYGHIEGKNVFYWFQNHKARQRQKQKQESLDCFNRCYLHQPSPVFTPNVVCSPYFIPQRELGFRPNKLLLPGGIIQTNPMNDGIEYCNSEVVDKDYSGSKQKTLTLFPLEPTGTGSKHTLRSRTMGSSENVGNEESSRGSSTLV